MFGVCKEWFYCDVTEFFCRDITSFNLPPSLRVQSGISCYSFNAFQQLPKKSGSVCSIFIWMSYQFEYTTKAIVSVKVKKVISLTQTTTYQEAALDCGLLRLLSAEKLVSAPLLKCIPPLWWIVECLCEIVGQFVRASDSKAWCSPWSNSGKEMLQHVTNYYFKQYNQSPNKSKHIIQSSCNKTARTSQLSKTFLRMLKLEIDESLKTHSDENRVFCVVNLLLWHVSDARGHIFKLKIAFLSMPC